MSEMDLCITAVRRPTILSQTLESMDQFVFSNIQFANVYLNIDPFMGTTEDAEACRRLVLDRFPNAIIRCPESPSFCGAVQWLWSMTVSPYFLHMEDDWLFHEDVTPRMALSLFSENVIQAAIMNEHFSWNGKDKFAVKRRKKRFIGIPYARTVETRFGTSPGFWKTSAAKNIASLMNTELDPEKQMKPQNNPLLFNFISQYKCAYLIGQNNPNIITDIGRDWLASQGIKKFVKNGKSWWEKA